MRVGHDPSSSDEQRFFFLKVKELIFEEPITIPLLDAFVSRCDRVQHVVITAAPLEALHDAASYRKTRASVSQNYNTYAFYCRSSRTRNILF